jgi:HEAT repeat protein
MTRRDVSSAAIYALRKLADPHTTFFFIQLLDSQDSDRQFTAVIALAEINHKYGDFAPGMGLFEKDRRKYIQRWKEWYRAKSQSKRDLQ